MFEKDAGCCDFVGIVPNYFYFLRVLKVTVVEAVGYSEWFFKINLTPV